LQILLVCHIYF